MLKMLRKNVSKKVRDHPFKTSASFPNDVTYINGVSKRRLIYILVDRTSNSFGNIILDSCHKS